MGRLSSAMAANRRNSRGAWGDIDLQVKNEDAIRYLVRSLDEFERNKVIRAGLASAGAYLRSQGADRLRMRMRNPNGITGNLLESMHFRVKRRRLGVIVGFKRPEGSHAHLIDEGTSERQSRYRKTGKVKPTYFWTETKNEDQQDAWYMLEESIEKAVNRINNRQ